MFFLFLGICQLHTYIKRLSSNAHVVSQFSFYSFFGVAFAVTETFLWRLFFGECAAINDTKCFCVQKPLLFHGSTRVYGVTCNFIYRKGKFRFVALSLSDFDVPLLRLLSLRSSSYFQFSGSHLYLDYNDSKQFLSTNRIYYVCVSVCCCCLEENF